MKKCVFIGGKQIGTDTLRALIAADIRPQLVIANPDDDGMDGLHESLIAQAKKYSLPLLIGVKVRDREVVQKIKELKPELIFCIGAMQIIPEEVLAIPTLGTVNLHPALLPKYRGRYSTVHALFNGETETGVTLHFMDSGIDSGPIIAQSSYPITEDDTGETLYKKFTREGAKLIVQFIANWKSGKKINATPQNEAEATYYPKGLPNGGEIDWSWSGAQILRFIRAMTFPPYPPASFHIGKRKMVIVEERDDKKDAQK